MGKELKRTPFIDKESETKEEESYQSHLKKEALKNACATTGCCMIPALLLIGYFCFPLIVFMTDGHWRECTGRAGLLPAQ